MTRTHTASASDPRKAALEAIPPVERREENGRLTLTRAFRGLSVEQAIGYLERLGGERTGEASVEGADWTATLSSTQVPVGPSYRLTQVTITWQGDTESVDRVAYRFRLKAFRAPG
jgi:hypothetical protein